MNLWITSKDLEGFIGQKENFELLEDCLSDTTSVYLALRQRKSNLDFGGPVTHDTLDAIVPKVAEETMRFLEVSDVPDIDYELRTLWDAIKTCSKGTLVNLIVSEIGLLSIRGFEEITGALTKQVPWLPISKMDSDFLVYFGGIVVLYHGIMFLQRYHTGGIGSLITSHLDSEDKKIRLAVNNAVSVVGDFAHEYAHVIQILKKVGIAVGDPIREGHARGVERAVARAFAEQDDNPAYNYQPLRRTASDLKDAYLFICKKTHRTPRESLRKSKISNTRNRIQIFHGRRSISHEYSIGTSAFCVAEARHGLIIYQNVLRNDYSALQ